MKLLLTDGRVIKGTIVETGRTDSGAAIVRMDLSEPVAREDLEGFEVLDADDRERLLLNPDDTEECPTLRVPLTQAALGALDELAKKTNVPVVELLDQIVVAAVKKALLGPEDPEDPTLN